MKSHSGFNEENKNYNEYSSMANDGRDFRQMETQRQWNSYTPYVKQFKGRCNYCGKIGHKLNACPEKAGEKDQRTSRTYTGEKGKCIHCLKDTHPSDRCWELDKNSGFRPNNWTSVKLQRGRQDMGEAKRFNTICNHCESPKHKSEECPTIKLQNIKLSEEKTKKTTHIGMNAWCEENNDSSSNNSSEPKLSTNSGSSAEYGFTRMDIMSNNKIKKPKRQC